MKASEAIEFLRMHFEYLKERWKPYPDYNVLEAIRFAISALEKQVSKKPRKNRFVQRYVNKSICLCMSYLWKCMFRKIHERTAEYNVLLELRSKIRLG